MLDRLRLRCETASAIHPDLDCAISSRDLLALLDALEAMAGEIASWRNEWAEPGQDDETAADILREHGIGGDSDD